MTLNEFRIRTQQLVDEASAFGWNVTVSQKPLAMGHHETVVDVWPARRQSEMKLEPSEAAPAETTGLVDCGECRTQGCPGGKCRNATPPLPAPGHECSIAIDRPAYTAEQMHAYRALPPSPQPDEQVLFEQEMHMRGRQCLKDDKGDYLGSTCIAWEVWQMARAAKPAHGRPQQRPNEQQILAAAIEAGLVPNTVHAWMPAFHRYHESLNRTFATQPATDPRAEQQAAGVQSEQGQGTALEFIAAFGHEAQFSRFTDSRPAAPTPSAAAKAGINCMSAWPWVQSAEAASSKSAALAAKIKHLADKYRVCSLNNFAGVYQDMCAAIDRLASIPQPAVPSEPNLDARYSMTAREAADAFTAQAGAASAMPSGWIDEVMAQAQVFASAWALVGGQFDFGSALSDAESAKAELREMLTAPSQPNPLREPSA